MGESKDNRPAVVRLRPDDPDLYTLMLEQRLMTLAGIIDTHKATIKRLEAHLDKYAQKEESRFVERLYVAPKNPKIQSRLSRFWRSLKSPKNT